MAMSLERESLRRPEQRGAERAHFYRRAWCEHRDLTLYALVTDIGCGGMFIQTATPFSVGERLRVSLLDRPNIVVDVEIVRSAQGARHAGVGCRLASFVQGADSYAALVSHLLESAR